MLLRSNVTLAAWMFGVSRAAGCGATKSSCPLSTLCSIFCRFGTWYIDLSFSSSLLGAQTSFGRLWLRTFSFRKVSTSALLIAGRCRSEKSSVRVLTLVRKSFQWRRVRLPECIRSISSFVTSLSSWLLVISKCSATKPGTRPSLKAFKLSYRRSLRASGSSVSVYSWWKIVKRLSNGLKSVFKQLRSIFSKSAERISSFPSTLDILVVINSRSRLPVECVPAF